MGSLLVVKAGNVLDEHVVRGRQDNIVLRMCSQFCGIRMTYSRCQKVLVFSAAVKQIGGEYELARTTSSGVETKRSLPCLSFFLASE